MRARSSSPPPAKSSVKGSTTSSTFLRSRTLDTPNRSLMLMIPSPRTSMWCSMSSLPLPTGENLKPFTRARMPRTLILEPTRELAAQVEESFIKYGKNHKLSIALLIGGVSFDDQDAKLMRGVDVLIATPGRLLDHFERGRLLLTGVELLVIDEADRMLDMGFIPDIERICKLVPFTRQTLFFSATMPPEIQRLTNTFLSNPVQIEVAKPASTVNNIAQKLVHTSSKDFEKRDVLRKLIRSAEATLNNGIIFCNRKRDVATLHKSLVKHGFNAAALHGDMDQRARMAALDAFRKGETKLLVASDVAARGLDIPEVSHVFNFDVPYHAEDYVHRIGRTGRAGRSGEAFTLVSRADGKSLDAIEKLIGQRIEWLGGEQPTAEIEPAAPEATEGRGRRDSKQRGRRGGRNRKPEKRASAPELAETGSKSARPEPKSAPKPQNGVSNDASQLPAFLHRPVSRKSGETVS